MATPLVTVVLPVYNAEKFLDLAISSILNQTEKNFELLIIDDGSTDNSRAIVDKYTDSRIRFIKHDKNQGLIKKLNEGLKEARAAYVARMDADDVSLPTRLEKEVRFLEKNPEVVAVGSGAQVLAKDGRLLATEVAIGDPSTLKRALCVGNIFFHGSVILRKSAVLKVGGYDRSAYLVEDYNLWVRLSKIGELANLEEPLYQWRSHGQSISNQNQNANLQNQSAQAIADQMWEGFGANGPVDPSWLKTTFALALKKPESIRKKYSQLFLALARACRRKNQPKTAQQLVKLAIQLSPAWFAGYGYWLISYLPTTYFLSAEQAARQALQRKRKY